MAGVFVLTYIYFLPYDLSGTDIDETSYKSFKYVLIIAALAFSLP
jgi:hypothetical protein